MINAYVKYANASHTTVQHDYILALEFNGINCPAGPSPIGPTVCEVGHYGDVAVKRATNSTQPIDSQTVQSDTGVDEKDVSYRLQFWVKLAESREIDNIR